VPDLIKKFDKEKGFRLLQENVKAFPEIISLPLKKYSPGPCALRSH